MTPISAWAAKTPPPSWILQKRRAFCFFFCFLWFYKKNWGGGREKKVFCWGYNPPPFPTFFLIYGKGRWKKKKFFFYKGMKEKIFFFNINLPPKRKELSSPPLLPWKNSGRIIENDKGEKWGPPPRKKMGKKTKEKYRREKITN